MMPLTTINRTLRTMSYGASDTPKNHTIETMRLISMVFVMLIHSPLDKQQLTTLPGYIIKQFLASGAVPLFFILSGYLSHHKLYSTKVTYSKYAINRFIRLGIPFISWNLLVLFAVLALKWTGASATLQNNGAYFDIGSGFTSSLRAIFGIGRCPIVYQFWFLRDLFVISIIAPPLTQLLPRTPILPLVFLAIPHPFTSSLGFFLLGLHLNNQKMPASSLTARTALIYCALWLLVGTLAWSTSTTSITVATRLGSAAFMLMLAIPFSRYDWSRSITGSLVFFVYATHEPFQTIIAKIWNRLEIPGYGGITCLLVIPSIVLIACTAIHRILNNSHLSIPLRFMTGSR